MQAYFVLVRRELGSFFASLTGYVIIAAAALLMEQGFVTLLRQVQGQPTQVPVTQLYYATSYFWMIILLVAPVITMRLFALEKYSGTFETLMTTPISDTQVVLAKFSAAMIFYAVLWLPLLGSFFVLRHYLANAGSLDIGILASTFLGILLVGGLFISLGCLASALTSSQLIAVMISFTLGFALFLLGYLPVDVNAAGGWLEQALSFVALFDHMNDFAGGIVDTRHVVFYVSFTVLFLFFTLRVVQSRRWK